MCPDVNKELQFLSKNSSLVYLRVAIAYRRMITFITLAGAILSLIICVFLPNIYSATSLILPPQQEMNLMGAMLNQMGGLAGLAGDVLGGGSTADMYVGILKSDAIKDPIIDRFDLQQLYGEKHRDSTYKKLDEYVTVMAGKKDGIISIAVEDTAPKRAADIANAYVEELEKLLVRMASTGASQNKSYIADRLTKARSDLAKAEDALRMFQSNNKALDITEQAKASIAGVADLKAQLIAQQVQLATLRSQFTDSSEEVKTVLASIANLQKQIARQEGKNGVSSIPSIGSIPALGEEYLRLMREFKIQENLVELLTKQYELANFSEQKDIANIQIIQKARVPDCKVKPKKALIVVGSTVASFMLALFTALLLGSYRVLPEEQKVLLGELRQTIFSGWGKNRG